MLYTVVCVCVFKSQGKYIVVIGLRGYSWSGGWGRVICSLPFRKDKERLLAVVGLQSVCITFPGRFTLACTASRAFSER